MPVYSATVCFSFHLSSFYVSCKFCRQETFYEMCLTAAGFECQDLVPTHRILPLTSCLVFWLSFAACCSLCFWVQYKIVLFKFVTPADIYLAIVSVRISLLLSILAQTKLMHLRCLMGCNNCPYYATAFPDSLCSDLLHLT